MHLKVPMFFMGGAVVFGLSQWALAGPDWLEDGDAGSTIQSAQAVNPGGGVQISRISGSLTGAASVSGVGLDDYEDVYMVLVTDPLNLLFSTVGGGADFQTSMWLFDSNGYGLLGNMYATGFLGGLNSDDEFTGSTIGNSSTDGTEITISTPGVYYIAISCVSRIPLSDQLPMFYFDRDDEVSGPDGKGGGTLSGWKGEGCEGTYQIDVEGVSSLPAPGVIPLLALGYFGVGGRRRRRSR